MATSEALVKYYDCLRDSFNKIQDKDNKTALVNAALRPKIREEFDKSQKVLFSYLDYIQVFSVIYCDKFSQICNCILVPLFKTYDINPQKVDNNNVGEADILKNAIKIHETIKEIIKLRPEAAQEFINCVIKSFPEITDEEKIFKTYISNCLEISTYLIDDEENLITLVAKVLDKLNPSYFSSSGSIEADKLDSLKTIASNSYELIYDHVDKLADNPDEKLVDSFVTVLSKVFVKDFVSSPIQDNLKYLILYANSLDPEYSDNFINLLWETFLNVNCPIHERIATVNFASSFISRADYVTLDHLFSYLEKVCEWCNSRIDEYNMKSRSNLNFSEDVQTSFYAITQSIFYIITQRYREMYEEETIKRLSDLKLDKIIESPLKPLEACDNEIEQRFKEVSSLYRIFNTKPIRRSISSYKRRKSDNHITKPAWKPVYREDGASLPDRIEPLYRCYYHHKFFTIHRDK